MKTLVAFFSAESGKTAGVAKKLASEIEADLFEIKPTKPYDKADLNYLNPMSRCNREKVGKKDVPVEGRVQNFEDYDTVILGFPIWYGVAPNVVNTFCKEYNWSGKKVAAFATSGGSGIGKTAEKLRPYVQGATSVNAKRVSTADEVKNWLENL
ncbi:MAG: NAD(P)H-dependent oxidoreductase [Lachnospiraceae bacterium]|nr:NAD(P)H-dependent oxidoreductase [Lachnospiraceae bacterium]